jgi:hypothetical protein
MPVEKGDLGCLPMRREEASHLLRKRRRATCPPGCLPVERGELGCLPIGRTQTVCL